MQIAVSPENSMFDERWICGSSKSSDSIDKFTIDDRTEKVESRAVPVLE